MNRTLRREKTSGAPLFWATLLMVFCLGGAMFTSESMKREALRSEPKFCWAGWTAENIWSDVAVNGASLDEDNVLPVMKAENTAQLDNIRTHLTGHGLTVTDKYGEMPSFDGIATIYDDAFFKDKVLLLVYITESSGSIRHQYVGLKAEDNTAVIQIRSVSGGDTHTEDMAGWLAMIPVARTELSKYEHMTAVRTAG